MALSLRVTADLKKRLEQNAELNGRSLSQEAEFRLEHTFDRQGLLLEVLKLAFGVGWAGFIIFNGSKIQAAQRRCGGPVAEDFGEGDFVLRSRKALPFAGGESGERKRT